MRQSLPALVSTDWLEQRLGQASLRVVDGSWYLAASHRDPAAEYRAEHIPGAVFFDLDATSDPQSTLPHMLPSAEGFARRMSGLGLGDGDDIVVYDGSGANLSAARVWWMFRVFGHPRVAVLDGGIGKWKREGRPLEAGDVSLPPGRLTARLRPGAVRALEEVRDIVAQGGEGSQIVDMRSGERFAGTEPEPRPGLRGGHIPGSLSLPYTELVAADGTMLPAPALRRRIEEAGIIPSRPVIATCGSGVTACTLIHALHLLGEEQTSLYDGAWTEWGGRSDTPVQTGSPRD